MRNLLFGIACCLFFISFAAAQATDLPNVYKKINPLVKEYQSAKIKRLMADYKDDKIIVVTEITADTLTKKKAREAGLIALATEIRSFQIEEPIYFQGTSFIELKNIDRQKEYIVSDDGSIVFDEQSQRYKAQSYLIDTAVFYTVNKETFDTTGICQKEIKIFWRSNPIARFGDINNGIITVDLLKYQKQLSIGDDYTFVSAIVYFVGGNFKTVSRHYLKTNDLSILRNAIDSCVDGSKIIFDNIIVKNENGELLLATMPVITVGSFDRDSKYQGNDGLRIGTLIGSKLKIEAFKKQKKIYISVHDIPGMEFESARVYIGGEGFSKVEVINLIGPSLAPLYPLFQKFQPGTQISFDNVRVTGPDGIRYIEGQTFLLY